MTEFDNTTAVIQDIRNAPIVYCEGAAGVSVNGEMIGIALCATIPTVITKEKVEMRSIVVAHLRMSVAAAVNIRNALDKALLMAAPAGGSAS